MSQPTSQPAKRFKIATFNVLYENPDIAAVVATIAKADADVVCVQESTGAFERAAKAKLGKTYEHTKFRNGRWADGFAILSKHPLEEAKYLPRKHGSFGTYEVVVKLAKKPVRIVNLHLSATQAPRRGGVRAFHAAFARQERIRRTEIAHIMGALEEFPQKHPLIIVGDFNTLSTMAATKYLTSRGFVDSFASVTKEADEHPTWSDELGGRKFNFRVDYIFHEKSLRTVASSITPCRGSDHALVLSVLEWSPSPATQPAGKGKAEGQSKEGD